MIGIKRCAALAIALCLPAHAQPRKFYTYIGDIGPDFVLIAWGTAAGVNTIGRSSAPHGKASIQIGDRTETVADRNWFIVRGLTPDTEYAYRTSVNGVQIGQGRIRTWPLKSERLCFFVIGDWGTAGSLQYQVAGAMKKELDKRAGSPCPVRFVLTTGDNIYGTQLVFGTRNSGRLDTEWGPKFFQPYEGILSAIPFFPVLGNHDGDESENRGDLAAYLDNFFFSGFSPARYYRFSYGGLVDFFALDSTLNSEDGSLRPAYAQGGDQHQWLQKNLAQSEVRWKIPYLHHPPFTAGPRHAASNRDLAHFLDAFRQYGVKVVFTGHEHNFQFSMQNAATNEIRYVVSGAGGELRTGNVRSVMQASHIEGWSPQAHFLFVEIEGAEMRILPVSFEPVKVFDSAGKTREMPVRVRLP